MSHPADSELVNFGQGLSRHDFQSWKDWLVKRDLANYPWKIGELSGNKFQGWMYKRRFASPSIDGSFNDLDKSKFQEWVAWVTKRGLSSKTPFSRFSGIDKSNFQHWTDWISKRIFDMGAVDFGPSFGSSNGFQNWAEYIKRQNYVFPPARFDMVNKANLQNWRDWVERMNTGTLMTKRQLPFSSDKFGSFRRYFTDGFQDWQATYKTKRDHANSSDKVKH